MSDPHPEMYFGNVADDDAEVIDNLIESDPTPPEAQDLPYTKGPDVPVPVAKKVIARLVSETRNYPASTAPVQVLAEDPNRKVFHLTIFGAEVDAAIADNPNALTQAMSTCFIIAAPGTLDLSDYTGPLWIKAAPDSDPSKTLSFSILAVTD